tara:strand:- start:568 stop:756 length:189 start_codon:yes stop_codon:yes gene_type:complete
LTVSPTCASFSAGVFSALADDDEADEDEAVFDALVEALSPLTCDAVSQAASRKVAATIANMR